MKLRVVATYQGKVFEADFDKDMVFVGRNCDFNVPDSLVSTKHLRLRTIGENIYVKDCSSANGTIFNGKKLDDEVLLLPDDNLMVGRTRVQAWSQIELKVVQNDDFTRIAPPIATIATTENIQVNLPPIQSEIPKVETGHQVASISEEPLKPTAVIEELKQEVELPKVEVQLPEIKPLKVPEKVFGEKDPPPLPTTSYWSKTLLRYGKSHRYISFLRLIAATLDLILFAGCMAGFSFLIFKYVSVPLVNLSGMTWYFWKNVNPQGWMYLGGVILSAFSFVYVLPALAFKKTLGMMVNRLTFFKENRSKILVRQLFGVPMMFVCLILPYFWIFVSARRRHFVDWLFKVDIGLVHTQVHMKPSIASEKTEITDTTPTPDSDEHRAS